MTAEKESKVRRNLMTIVHQGMLETFLPGVNQVLKLMK